MLEILFFITALIYALIGFGGGSTYNALLVLGNTDYQLIPFISLICNILVVSGGVWHFYRGGHIQIMRIAPWIIFSIPASFVGGIISVPEIIFTGVLGCSLLLSGIRLLWGERVEKSLYFSKLVPYNRYTPAILGISLGLLAGITGIGGGIFLAPILHSMRWGNAKEIAGACALFILFNSLAGLIGQCLKMAGTNLFPSLFPYWILLPAVIMGGQIGSWLGTTKINMIIVRKMTGLLIIYVSMKLIIRFIEAL